MSPLAALAVALAILALAEVGARRLEARARPATPPEPHPAVFGALGSVALALLGRGFSLDPVSLSGSAVTAARAHGCEAAFLVYDTPSRVAAGAIAHSPDGYLYLFPFEGCEVRLSAAFREVAFELGLPLESPGPDPSPVRPVA